jgi:hypothetical protein
LDTNGIPEDLTLTSDLLFEFLVTAEIITESGDLVEHNKEVVKEEPVPEAAAPTPDVKPECYGYEDDRDPACNKCKLQVECRQVRIANRPDCFGKLYETVAPECAVCIEAPFCAIIFKNQKH